MTDYSKLLEQQIRKERLIKILLWIKAIAATGVVILWLLAVYALIHFAIKYW